MILRLSIPRLGPELVGRLQRATLTKRGSVSLSVGANDVGKDLIRPVYIEIEADSFKAFWKLAGEKATESGIMTVPAYDFYGNPPFDKVNPWFKDLVPSVS